jgi:hypothetical protein
MRSAPKHHQDCASYDFAGLRFEAISTCAVAAWLMPSGPLPLFADGLAVHGHVLLSGQASQDLGVHPSQLRDWVKKFADDPQHAFPGHGQMNPAMVASMRVPAIYPFREYVQSGGLVSYGANLPDMYRRAANYVDSLHPSSPPRATLL